MSKNYSAGSLIRHYRAARRWEPDREFVRIDWCTVLTAREWLAWFRGCLLEKIMSTAPTVRGRKTTREWQQTMSRLADKLKRRVCTRERECPPEYRGQLAHCFCEE